MRRLGWGVHSLSGALADGTIPRNAFLLSLPSPQCGKRNSCCHDLLVATSVVKNDADVIVEAYVVNQGLGRGGLSFDHAAQMALVNS